MAKRLLLCRSALLVDVFVFHFFLVLFCLTLFHFIFRLPTTCDELKNWWRRLLSVAMSVYLWIVTWKVHTHTHTCRFRIYASCIAIGSDTLLHSCSKTTNLWLWLYGQFIDFVFYMYRIHSIRTHCTQRSATAYTLTSISDVLTFVSHFCWTTKLT